MLEPEKNLPSNERLTNSQFYFVQPVHSRLMTTDNPAYEYFNAKYLSFSPPPAIPIQKPNCKLKSTKTCDSCINPVFLTNQGFEICPCGKTSQYKLPNGNDDAKTNANASETTTKNSEQVIKDNLKKHKVDLQVTRSSSCDDNYGENYKKDRRVSILVDELLLKIYGDRDRKFSSGGTDIKDTVDCSTDSSNGTVLFGKSTALLKKKRSFSGIPEDKFRKWEALIRTRLMAKSLNELIALKETLNYNISHTGSQLIRQLKRRDLLFSRRDAQCDVITAFLQAKSAKRSEDTKMQFSMKPSAGESGFQQWHSAMKMVARLPGGIPREFRKTLWLTLAERHISSRKINWRQVEKRCFNDSTNPDDEELGVQIVKDLHRTGCSLFCGTSGEQNQAVLKRVLLAYARWNKSVGYCQGFNMLAALILEVMDRCEYDSLKVMIYLIEGVLPESYFANSLRGLSIDMAVFRDLLRLKLPELSKHLEQLQTGGNDAGEFTASANTYEPPLTNVFTMQWFLTLFCNCLPHSTVLRVWDLVFLEGNQVLLKTALAIWDTLSDRIMPVKSADEFYSIMGVLTREMLEFGLMDANSLVKTITSIELSELTELRERYIYNITPWTQVARKGLRLFYSDDESDDSDEEQNDDKVSEGAYGFLKAATKHGSQSIRSISPSSILSPFANEKDKIALDISALKKQYCKIKERQRQAQIIFTAACNTHGLMGSVVSSTPTPAINHLLLNKPPVVIKAQKVQKQAAIPMSRAVQRLKESSSSIGDDTSKDRGETVYWDKRVKKKKRKKHNDVICSNSAESKQVSENQADSDSSSSSYSSASVKSSTSTELCDDLTEFDSDNTSLSEYCSSPLLRIQSSSLSLLDDIKTDNGEPGPTEETRDEGAYEESNRTGFDEGEHILNVLLTTSILVNEQMNQQESSDNLGEPISEENFTRQLPRDTVIGSCVNSEIYTKVDSVCDNRADNYFIGDSCDISSAISPVCGDEEVTHDVNQQSVPESRVSSDELETALEHMKIDALEILFSTRTLESIRNESLSMDDNCSSFVVPGMTEGDKSDKEFDETSQLEFTSAYNSERHTCEYESAKSLEVMQDADIDNFGESEACNRVIVHSSPDNVENTIPMSIDVMQCSLEGETIDKDLSNITNNSVLRSPAKESINRIMENQIFDFDCFATNPASTVPPECSKLSEDLVDFRPSTSPLEEITNCTGSAITNDWSWETDNFCDDDKTSPKVEPHHTSSFVDDTPAENEKSSILPFDIFDNRYNTNPQQSPDVNEPQHQYDTLISFDSTSPVSSMPDFNSKPEDITSSCKIEAPTPVLADVHNEQLNNTETALENILRENTEVLKKVYHKYKYSQSCDFDTVSLHYNTVGSDNENRKSLPSSRLKTKDIKFLSLDYPIHFEDLKKRPRRKHKSLDSLNTKKSKLKIGLVSKHCKWISISIDNSDLGVFNTPAENNKLKKPDYLSNSIETTKPPSTHGSTTAYSHKINNLNSSEYLHLNFDIIGTCKKKKDPIQEYVHKKNVLAQNFKSPSELAPLNFNPFPSRSNTRPPKELGVKLGLYSSNKTK